MRVFVERGRRHRPDVREVVEMIDPARVSLVDDVTPMAVTDSPQGLVAECRPIEPVSLEDLRLATDAVLVLDHIEDPHNTGAIARSAAAAGVGGLVTSGRRAAPLSAAAFKTAVGALERVPVAVVGSIPDALARLKALGFWVVGLSPTGDQRLFGLSLLTEPVAIVVGAEGRGLSRLTAQRCDVLASIPMAAGAESLNASVSAALASFEIMRVRGDADRPPPG
jgi:23S rRNA (guanosine2251-2'-O)-methyltransferase